MKYACFSWSHTLDSKLATFHLICHLPSNVNIKPNKRGKKHQLRTCYRIRNSCVCMTYSITLHKSRSSSLHPSALCASSMLINVQVLVIKCIFIVITSDKFKKKKAISGNFINLVQFNQYHSQDEKKDGRSATLQQLYILMSGNSEMHSMCFVISVTVRLSPS